MSELCKECGRYKDDPSYSCDCDQQQEITELKLLLNKLIPVAEDLLTWCSEEDKKFIYEDVITKIKERLK